MKPQRIFIVTLVILLGLLQYKLWVSPNGITQFWQLKQNIAQVNQEKALVQEKNTRILAEITHLKVQGEAIEERARMDLGLIKPGEIFYQLVD